MNLSDFSEQFNSTLKDWTIPKDSALAASVQRTREILKRSAPTLEAAYQSLQEIAAIFGGEVAQQHPHVVEKVFELLNAQAVHIQKIAAVALRQQQGEAILSPSLAMIGFPIAPGVDVSQPRPGSIACAVDQREVFLDRDQVVSFFQEHYQVGLTTASDDQLRQIMENVCREALLKPLSQERVIELVRRVAVGVQLFSVSSVQPSPAVQLYTARQLVENYRSRGWSDSIPITVRGTQMSVGGYLPHGSNAEERAQSHQLEKNYLVRLVQAHNQQFAASIQHLQAEDEGFIEKLALPPNTVVYVRADLHSDLASLLAQLDLLRAQGMIDENYRCRPGFHMIFLGDYADRGANDIEVLTLLLTLRSENPSSVHLIRGNHEDVAVQRNYSHEGAWFEENGQVFSECYKSLPLAICVGEKGQAVHFSHGLFSPAVDLFPLFESDRSCMIVKKQPLMVERRYDQKGARMVAKQRAAFQRLMQLPPQASEGRAILWSDVGDTTAPSERGVGYVLSPDDIHAWARYVGVKALFRGHEHGFEEKSVVRESGERGGRKKVIASTLPVGAASSAYPDLQEVRQGMVFQVAEKAEDWKKWFSMAEGKGRDVRLRIERTPRFLYEKYAPPDVEMEG